MVVLVGLFLAGATLPVWYVPSGSPPSADGGPAPAASCTAFAAADGDARRVLVVTLDGADGAAVHGALFGAFGGATYMPRLRAALETATAAGVQSAWRYQPCEAAGDPRCATSSAAAAAGGAASALTGVASAKHNVTGDAPARQAAFAATGRWFPSLFARAGAAGMRSAASGAPPLLSAAEPSGRSRYGVLDFECGGTAAAPAVDPQAGRSCNLDFRRGQARSDPRQDAKTAEFVGLMLVRGCTEVNLAHFVSLDAAGRACGSGTTAACLDQLAIVDGLVGNLLDAVNVAVRDRGEEFLVIVSAGHGGPAGDGSVPFMVGRYKPSTAPRPAALNAFRAPVRQVDVAATALAWLELGQGLEGLLDGRPQGLNAEGTTDIRLASAPGAAFAVPAPARAVAVAESAGPELLPAGAAGAAGAALVVGHTLAASGAQCQFPFVLRGKVFTSECAAGHHLRLAPDLAEMDEGFGVCKTVFGVYEACAEPAAADVDVVDVPVRFTRGGEPCVLPTTFRDEAVLNCIQLDPADPAEFCRSAVTDEWAPCAPLDVALRARLAPADGQAYAVDGRPCLFPVVYAGAEVNECVGLVPEAAFCPVAEVVVDGRPVSEWAMCAAAAAGGGQPPRDRATQDGRRCLFPVVFDGRAVSDCVQSDSPFFAGLGGQPGDAWCQAAVRVRYATRYCAPLGDRRLADRQVVPEECKEWVRCEGPGVSLGLDSTSEVASGAPEAAQEEADGGAGGSGSGSNMARIIVPVTLSVALLAVALLVALFLRRRRRARLQAALSFGALSESRDDVMQGTELHRAQSNDLSSESLGETGGPEPLPGRDPVVAQSGAEPPASAARDGSGIN